MLAPEKRDQIITFYNADYEVAELVKARKFKLVSRTNQKSTVFTSDLNITNMRNLCWQLHTSISVRVFWTREMGKRYKLKIFLFGDFFAYIDIIIKYNIINKDNKKKLNEVNN